jgi:hypothetical protein
VDAAITMAIALVSMAIAIRYGISQPAAPMCMAM